MAVRVAALLAVFGAIEVGAPPGTAAHTCVLLAGRALRRTMQPVVVSGRPI